MRCSWALEGLAKGGGGETRAKRRRRQPPSAVYHHLATAFPTRCASVSHLQKVFGLLVPPLQPRGSTQARPPSLSLRVSASSSSLCPFFWAGTSSSSAAPPPDLYRPLSPSARIPLARLKSTPWTPISRSRSVLWWIRARSRMLDRWGRSGRSGETWTCEDRAAVSRSFSSRRAKC